MPDEIISIGLTDVDTRVRQELGTPLGAQRQQRFKRFLLAALGSIPWVGTVINAAASAAADRDQQRVNELYEEWLAEHKSKLLELGKDLVSIIERLEKLGTEIETRIQSDQYLNIVRKSFRVWDQADTAEKRQLVRQLLGNAAGSSMTSDDVVRLFIQWIDYYHEAHFAVIREIYRNPGCTRAEMWENIHGTPVREDSAEADLFKLLVRDLSMGSVVRQHRETTADGSFLRKTPSRRNSGPGSRLMKSAFDDKDQYELTELGNQFVHYAMTEVVPRIGSTS